MSELDLWNHLWMASGSQGTWFLALGFLSWVGLRAGQNIYNNSDTPILMKISGTVFCLFIHILLLDLMNNLLRDVGWVQVNSSLWMLLFSISSEILHWVTHPPP